MKNINNYVEEMNFLDEKLCNLDKVNKRYAKSIKNLKISRNIGISLGVLLIPYLMYFIKFTDLTATSNVYLMVVGALSFGSISYGLIQSSIRFMEETKKEKNICEEDITETKRQLKLVTIKHDNCLTNNLEKNNITSFESKYENKVENTNQKAKAYTKTLKKDNE